MQSMQQVLKLAQSLNLSPTMLQSMKLLQMNTQELSDYLQEVLLENPTLEEDEAARARAWEEISALVPWSVSKAVPGEELSPFEGSTPSGEDSLSLFLHDQLARLKLSKQIRAIADYLIDSLDDRGYLSPEDLTDLSRSGVPSKMLSEALFHLQSLEPSGIAARSLTECLTLQLSRQTPPNALALSLVQHHLTDLSKHRYEAISKAWGVAVSAVKEAEALIQSLEPYPGRAFAPEEPTIYVKPDAYIATVEGETRVFCNHWDLPHLSLREDYLTLLRSTDNPELSHYLREKLQQAQWLLQCLDRRGSTLTQCLQAMVSRQPAFFNGDTVTVLPMTQSTLAAQLGLHPSTVSRTIRNKYLQCRQGLFPLSHFFSRAVGKEALLHSESMIKQEILRLIREEASGTALSDQKIASLLKAKDIQVSRRTVSKYRSQLGLSSSYNRRRTE